MPKKDAQVPEQGEAYLAFKARTDEARALFWAVKMHPCIDLVSRRQFHEFERAAIDLAKETDATASTEGIEARIRIYRKAAEVQSKIYGDMMRHLIEWMDVCTCEPVEGWIQL